MAVIGQPCVCVHLVITAWRPLQAIHVSSSHRCRLRAIAEALKRAKTLLAAMQVLCDLCVHVFSSSICLKAM